MSSYLGDTTLASTACPRGTKYGTIFVRGSALLVSALSGFTEELPDVSEIYVKDLGRTLAKALCHDAEMGFAA